MFRLTIIVVFFISEILFVFKTACNPDPLRFFRPNPLAPLLLLDLLAALSFEVGDKHPSL